jgi:hypothetical protein
MPNILLYHPPSNALRKPVLPMSLLALGALLEGVHDYRIIDGNVEPDGLETISRAVRDEGVDLLGVTVMPGPQLSHAVPLCRELKRRHPELTIIWGGYFPTQHYDACMRSSYVDYVVRGHGEVSFVELIQALREGRDISDIPGVVAREVVERPRTQDPGPRNYSAIIRKRRQYGLRTTSHKPQATSSYPPGLPSSIRQTSCVRHVGYSGGLRLRWPRTTPMWHAVNCLSIPARSSLSNGRSTST